MAIAKYHEIMLPLLKFVADGKTYFFSDITEAMAKHYSMSDEERKIRSPSGARLFDGRVSWASTYLKKAKLIDKPERGTLVITERGKSVLNENLLVIIPRYLEKFDEFLDYIGKNRRENEEQGTEEDNFEESPPQEQLENAHRELTNSLVSDIFV